MLLSKQSDETSCQQLPINQQFSNVSSCLTLFLWEIKDLRRSRHFQVLFIFKESYCPYLTIKEPSKIAANATSIFFYFYLSKKIRLGVSSESSAVNHLLSRRST